MPGALLWGYDATNKVWIPLQVDANGYVIVDLSAVALNDLADVSVAAPADDDLFYYDSATSLWKSRKLVAADMPELTYDLCEMFLLPYLLYRHLVRFMHVQFDTYDMITEHTAGTGYTLQNFFRPLVRAGATSGGEAALYQNSPWLYLATIMTFAQGGYYINGTRDGTGFIGLALVDTHVITLNDVTKHAGFIFYVSGATATVYASNADGATQTKTDLSLDPTAYATWAIVGDGSSLKFYRNWTLVATHTTNIPAGTFCWKISVVSAENADAAIDARNFVYGQET